MMTKIQRYFDIAQRKSNKSHYIITLISFVLCLPSGEHCEVDYDACQDDPCGVGRTCTDIAAEDIVDDLYQNCSDCLAGYELEGGNSTKCVGKM